ncbi:AMP-binding protein [Luteolibacter sp. Populi]|uniref:AMP-binding protein n=1 Tax=Luteolibacter sp. Populi TaxID=3230487 RepID=UPI003464F425
MHSNTPLLEGPEAPFWSLLHHSAPAVVTEDGRNWSYAALQRQVDLVKGSLDAPAKSLVFVLSDHSIGCLAGYLACLQAGHALLLLPHDMDKTLLEPLVEIYRPDFIWSPQEIDRELHEDSGFGMDKHRLFRAREMGAHAPLYPDLALMLTTSGSTGNPKVVRLSYANLQANARSIAEYLRIDAGERPVTSLPIYYSYGLSVVNSHLFAGATLLQTGKRLRTPEFWEFARTHGATSIAGVPYVYQILHEMGFDGRELPSLRTMTQAGGHLDVTLQEHFMKLARKKGIRYFTMYGQTEATARMSYVPHERGAEGAGSIGVPIPGGSFEVVEGELVYSGPNVMLGYAENRADLAKGDELQGRLFTGDMARIGENGFCYLVGRKKRFVKIMGLRINLDDVERQLTAQVGRKCVVLGTDSNLEVVTPGHGLEDEIIEFIRKTYRISGKLCSVKVVAEIPVMSTGKVDYEALKIAPAVLPEKCGTVVDFAEEVAAFAAGNSPIAEAV